MNTTTHITRRRLAAALSLLSAAPALVAWPGSARAAAWPNRTIRLQVGFPAGSTPDLSARAIAEPLSQALGQAVIVENKPGASGNIAADVVAKSTDDHTLGVVINGNLTSAKALFSKLAFDPARDLLPLSLLTTAPLVLVTNADKPLGAEFFSAARASGETWNYGSVGVGSMGHLGMEILMSRLAGFKATHVPFNGNPAVINGLIQGQVQAALIPPGIAMPQVRGGKLKAIGITSAGRSSLVPELGTLAEAGLGSTIEIEVWTGLVGPARLSREAQARLAGLLGSLVRQPDTRQKLFNAGWQPVGTTADGFRDRVKTETALMTQIISSRGIKVE